MNRKAFYDAVRASVFGGSLSQGQVEGIEATLDEWEKRGLDDIRWLAYIIATDDWESGHTMQPIEEIGRGLGKSYGKKDQVTGKSYYGRGKPMLTWRANYEKFGTRLGIDLLNFPEKMLEMETATSVLFDGMIHGLFTGVGLPKYFSPSRCDWVNARRIVNGMDKADEIARVAKIMHSALKSARSTPETDVTQPSPPATHADPVADAPKDNIMDNDVLASELPPPRSIAEPIIAPAPITPDNATAAQPVTVVIPPPPVPWHSGWKTHVYMLVTGIFGFAAMLGKVPQITPDQGASMIQGALTVSGIRSALPSIAQMAINYYLTRATA